MTIRLNKVTRDLNVGIATVVEFLQKKGYTVEANPNTKITEEQYAILVKEFSTDKNLRIESERFIQERQNKDRNKASVAIDGYEKQPEKPKADDVIKTVVPEDARPKFKPVGKIDLNKFNRKADKEVVSVTKPQSESQPQTKPEPPKVTPTPVVEEKKVEEVVKPAAVEIKKENVVVASKPEVVKEVQAAVVEPLKPAVEEKVVEEVKKEEQKVEAAPEVKEEKVESKSVVSETTESENKADDVFKIRQPEFVSKINVIGQIDLAALNQSTRPKKKSKEEKRKEREEKEKVRQDQRKQIKDAIIKEIRKDDNKIAKSAPKENADVNAKKKRIRINKEKVDVNNVASNFAHPTPNSQT